MSEDALKTRISELERDIEKKDLEIITYLDKIEQLEDTIMKLEDRLEDLFPEDGDKKKGKKKQSENLKLIYELEEKDKEIRELKNKMGFLRKDKTQLQQELDRIKSDKDSSVIRVEDLRTKSPLNVLVKDLQDTVNKQRSQINKLKEENKDIEGFNEKIKLKEDEIDTLKSEISNLNEKLKDFSSIPSKNGDTIAKKLIEDLQNELNKSKRKFKELKQKLANTGKKPKKDEINTHQINGLKNSLKKKDEEIQKLKNELFSLKKEEIAINLENPDTTSTVMVKELKEDLQKKLNKAKLKIKTLENQIENFKSKEKSESDKTQKELEGKLTMQREMVSFLQKQLETKEGELETIKNEAVQIKRKYRQLENQLRLKDEKFNELQNQMETITPQADTPPQQEDNHLNLRLKELKTMIDDLKKQNNEQRIEISHLRKKS